jgi:hypothetical protein
MLYSTLTKTGAIGGGSAGATSPQNLENFVFSQQKFAIFLLFRWIRPHAPRTLERVPQPMTGATKKSSQILSRTFSLTKRVYKTTKVIFLISVVNFIQLLILQ